MKNDVNHEFWFTSIIIGALTSLVFLMFFVSLGHIPDTQEISLFSKGSLPLVIYLPWKISRLWDIVIIFAFSFVSVYLYNYFKKPKHRIEELYLGLFAGLIFGLIMALSLIIKISFEDIVVVSLLIILLLSFLLGFTFGLKDKLLLGLKFSLFFNLGAWLSIGVITILAYGLLFSLLSGIGFVLIINTSFLAGLLLGYIIKNIFSKKFWEMICS